MQVLDARHKESDERGDLSSWAQTELALLEWETDSDEPVDGEYDEYPYSCVPTRVE